ncbi:MAG: hypothetical protein QF782_05695, partial [Porticoccaceae bacterium]|nr:hypothetical protein [Porticoccaceae bacterium]
RLFDVASGDAIAPEIFDVDGVKILLIAEAILLSNFCAVEHQIKSNQINLFCEQYIPIGI